MAFARSLAVNPANPDEFMILFGDGKIISYGGAPAVPQSEAEPGLDPSLLVPGTSGTAPTFFFQAPTQPAVALIVTDWDEPAGYVVNIWGSVYEFGSATASSDYPNFRPFQPAFGFVADFVMDPAANGKGYILDLAGDVWAIGAGVTAVPHSAFLTENNARSLAIDWGSLEYQVLDGRGTIHPKNSAPTATVTASHDRDVMAFTNTARKVIFSDWDAGDGFVLDQYGTIHEVGASGGAPGYRNTFPTPQWWDFAVLDDDPTELVEMTIGGALHRWIASSAPTVTVTFPNDPTTTTTRPTVSWGYSDAENDSQINWAVKVFDEPTYTAMGFDPDVDTPVWEDSGRILLNTVRVAVDLENGNYRAYVQVEDSSHLFSTWAYQEWEQDVTLPDTPTITATAGGAALDGIALAVNWPGTPDPDVRVAVQYRDADGITWAWVRAGVDLEPDGGGDVALVDYEARLGVERTYRALAYYPDWIAGAFSSTDADTLTDRSEWLLTNPDDPTLDRIVKVQPGFALDETVVAGVFAPAGRPDIVVVSDGQPRLPAVKAQLWALTGTERVALELLLAAQTLLLRDPFGRAYFGRLVGTVSQGLVHATPTATEETPIRDAHTFAITLQAIARPGVHSTTSPELDELVG